ncbi:uncharacterized protein LOC111812700 [Octodon degus]|uniref:Uncharacterized protein LOC111812700 n=1 Tax=Octodon degus TaxID=10160 RepID=A0A6P6DBF1_OCTDE|nr:uncharacterized protein LOC111812700 [Octodon degus]
MESHALPRDLPASQPLSAAPALSARRAGRGPRAPGHRRVDKGRAPCSRCGSKLSALVGCELNLERETRALGRPRPPEQWGARAVPFEGSWGAEGLWLQPRKGREGLRQADGAGHFLHCPRERDQARSAMPFHFRDVETEALALRAALTQDPCPPQAPAVGRLDVRSGELSGAEGTSLRGEGSGHGMPLPNYILFRFFSVPEPNQNTTSSKRLLWISEQELTSPFPLPHCPLFSH